MTVASEQKYPNLHVIRGNGGTDGRVRIIRGRRRGRRIKSAAELVLERDIRAAFAALEDANGNVPSAAIYKIRQGVQLPLGCFGRRIVEAHAAKCEHRAVRNIGQAIIDWIDKLYERSQDTVTEQVYYQGPWQGVA